MTHVMRAVSRPVFAAFGAHSNHGNRSGTLTCMKRHHLRASILLRRRASSLTTTRASAQFQTETALPLLLNTDIQSECPLEDAQDMFARQFGSATKLELRETPLGRGLVATDAIQEGDLLITVPWQGEQQRLPDAYFVTILHMTVSYDAIRACDRWRAAQNTHKVF